MTKRTKARVLIFFILALFILIIALSIPEVVVAK